MFTRVNVYKMLWHSVWNAYIDTYACHRWSHFQIDMRFLDWHIKYHFHAFLRYITLLKSTFHTCNYTYKYHLSMNMWSWNWLHTTYMYSVRKFQKSYISPFNTYLYVNSALEHCCSAFVRLGNKLKPKHFFLEMSKKCDFSAFLRFITLFKSRVYTYKCV